MDLGRVQGSWLYDIPVKRDLHHDVLPIQIALCLVHNCVCARLELLGFPTVTMTPSFQVKDLPNGSVLLGPFSYLSCFSVGWLDGGLSRSRLARGEERGDKPLGGTPA
jgi:hypothetical protein